MDVYDAEFEIDLIYDLRGVRMKFRESRHIIDASN